MKREKLTVEVATKAIIRQRATEDGLSIGAYLDSLVQRDDLRRRLALDRATLAASSAASSAATPAASSAQRAARNASIAAARSHRR